ncbi:MAG: methionyl-tRNA formyltransferase [Bacteroidetes bacterium]|nr:MAG: methionyl-tRNA formyltransferase [Bacteroidota bacterium]
MKNKNLKIIYFGTPDFAVAPLKKLIEAGKNVIAVVTAPDKPAGRGHKLQSPPVKQFAESHQIPVLQPRNLKSEAFLKELQSFDADLFIVVAFRMLPEQVWNMPPLGTFNLHASLLPQYRGAAPINWAVINGETQTGVTTFFIQHDIDTGNIILQKEVPISPSETAGELHNKLMKAGADLVLETVNKIENGNVETIPQSQLIKPGETLKTAPKIFKPDCRINWNNTVENIYNFIRGLAPYPAAYTEIEIAGERYPLKIFKVEKEPENHNETPGTLITDFKKSIKIAATNGFIELKEIQPQGKRKQTVKEFLNGIQNKIKTRQS